MSLQSYEAIYDHRQVKWLGDRPKLNRRESLLPFFPIKILPLRHLGINLLRESPAKEKYSATLLPQQLRLKLIAL